jgi:hypothetical protein
MDVSNEGDKPGPPPSISSLPPEQFQIPVQLLEQWVLIPPAERLCADLTRQDLDHLIFGLLRSAEAQQKLEQTVVSWSHNQLEAANANLAEFRRLNIDSLNNLRQFITGLMVSAIRGRSHG